MWSLKLKVWNQIDAAGGGRSKVSGIIVATAVLLVSIGNV